MITLYRSLRNWGTRAIFAGCTGIALLSGSLRAATPEQIDQAIAHGVAYIYSQQHSGGRWELDDRRDGAAHDFKTVGGRMQGDTYGGFSALAVYALLSAGESPTDKRIADAARFLKQADILGVYALGMRAQVWHMLASSKKDRLALREFIQSDANRLLSGVNQTGPALGLWNYGDGHGTTIDHSSSQFGILGLWALQDSGAEIPSGAWAVFDRVWRSHQFPDGGWGYDATPASGGRRGNTAETLSMTAAGVATLFIIEENINANVGNEHKNVVSPSITSGLKWIAGHIAEVKDNYGWFGVERIGVASGTKYFGTTDWFRVGADKLVADQQKDGSWAQPDRYGNALSSTCLAVLFLSRGRAPIMMNKLQYNVLDNHGKLVEGDWNERPRDAANVTRWTGDQIESNLNWQLVNLDVPAEELRDAPILYISGDRALKFNDEQIQKLKTFVEAGGLILGNADFDSQEFSASFQKLGTQMFDGEFRPLPADSPIWTEQNHQLTGGQVRLAGLSNGIRELMLLMDHGDSGRTWQRMVNPEHIEAYKLGANIFLYAVDKKNLVARGQSPVVIRDPQIQDAGTIKVARLRYGGNWDPEPGGWRRMSAIFHNTYRTNLNVQEVALGHHQLDAGTDAKDKGAAADSSVGPFKLAHMTGTTAFHLPDDQIAELRQFVDNGGTLIIDAGGGSSAFASSAEAMLRKLFPNSAEAALNSPLPETDKLYTLPQAPVEHIQFRAFARRIVGSLNGGRIMGITEKGRIVAYYSREDLSAGLVGEPMDGIVGYSPDAATAIVRNMILLSYPNLAVSPTDQKAAKPESRADRRRRKETPTPPPAQ